MNAAVIVHAPRSPASLDASLRILGRQLRQFGVTDELRKRRHYLSPGARRRRKAARARKRAVKAARRQQGSPT